MTVHRIMAPDSFAGHELRELAWNDEIGELTGDHTDVAGFAQDLAGPMPIHNRGSFKPNYVLEDPAHNPADFLALILELHDLGSPHRDRVQLPPTLRGVEPTPPLPDDTPPGALN